MPTCRKCQSPFSSKARVDGVKKNLQRRKFCLSCSPWGSRNTRPDLDAPPKTGAPCQSCGTATRNGSFCPSCWTALRRLRNKLRAIDVLGGECGDCRRPVHPAQADFHHLDPSVKKFEVSGAMGGSWASIEAELRGCVLLCANCHRLRHAANFEKLMKFV